MVSGFERAKAEALAYLDARAKAKAKATTKCGDPSLRSRMTT
jgi:hypothetical protein